jgi:putative FmdB family regulatory protein
MPFYEYQCRDCGRLFDKYVRSMASRSEVTCPDCGSKHCEKSLSLFSSSGTSRNTGSGAQSCLPSG